MAKQATAGALTPFDQAVALEQFLRTFPYNDQIPAPPAGVNAVNYFLFDVKQGYCDYYASSFAMMARSLGIPARVSAGYAQGEYTTEIDAYRVREYNGHSWPEVFFPGYGWVEFEPTASEIEIVREHRQEDTALAGPTPEPTSDPFLDKAEPFDPEAFGQGDLPDAANTGGLLGALLGLVDRACRNALGRSACRLFPAAFLAAATDAGFCSTPSSRSRCMDVWSSGHSVSGSPFSPARHPMSRRRC